MSAHISEIQALSLHTISPRVQGYWCQYRDRSNVTPKMEFNVKMFFISLMSYVYVLWKVFGKKWRWGRHYNPSLTWFLLRSSYTTSERVVLFTSYSHTEASKQQDQTNGSSLLEFSFLKDKFGNFPDLRVIEKKN